MYLDKSLERRLHATPTANVNEGAPLMAICNACRYCEGIALCQAMELGFNSDNLDYLANLVTTVDRATTIANTRRLMNSS